MYLIYQNQICLTDMYHCIILPLEEYIPDTYRIRVYKTPLLIKPPPLEKSN